MATYTFELWSNSGVVLADISALAHNRTYTIERNAEENLTFDLDMFAWEKFCARLGADPRVILTPDQVDVKVKRDGQYLFAAQIVAAPLNIGSDYTMSSGSTGGGPGSFNPTISVSCTGYLNLFKDRYLTTSFTGQERCAVAGALITQAQAVTNGNVGVTLAAGQYSTGTTDDVRTYTQQNVKDALQNLAALTDGRFDFAFGYDKKFYTYGQIGSERTDLAFVYGGPASNMIAFYEENSATSLYNEILALGSGFGPDQISSTADDNVSQLNNFLRQNISQHNSVEDQATLDQDAATDLAQAKDLLDLPQVSISGKELEGVPFLSVGDRIPLRFEDHPYLTALNGTYRIEKFAVTLDDNDFESEIRLYFDNFDLED